MLEVFPDAHLYCHIMKRQWVDILGTPHICVIFEQYAFAKTKHSMYLKLMPRAFESFNLSGYDVVISSSTSCAKEF